MSHDKWAKRYQYSGFGLTALFLVFILFGDSIGLTLLQQSVSLLAFVGIGYFTWLKYDKHKSRAQVEGLPHDPDGEIHEQQNRHY